MTSNRDRLKKGSRPPYLGLAEGFALATDIYEQGGGSATKDLMSRITKNSGSSSSFVRKVAALKAYGLIDEENGAFVLSEVGRGIAAPVSPESRAEAKKKAFLSVDVFARIFDRHKGKLLPADEFLKNIIEQDLSVSKDLSMEWVSAIKDSLKAASFLYDRGDGKLQIMESPIVRFPRMGGVSVGGNLVAAEPAPLAKDIVNDVQTPMVAPLPDSGHTTKILLSKQRYAVFSIPDDLTAKDAQKIKSAMTALSSVVDLFVDGGN